MGRPEHYLKGGGAGLAVAIAGGLVLNAVLGQVGFGSVILPGLLGFGVGRAVAWGAAGQSQQPFLAGAIALGVLGGVLAGGVLTVGLALLMRPFALLGVAAAAYGAARGLRG